MKKARTIQAKKLPEKAPKKIAEVKEQNLATIFSTYQIEGKSLLSEDQAKQLLALTNDKGKPLIQSGNSAQVFELLVRIHMYGYDSIYADLLRGVSVLVSISAEKAEEEKEQRSFKSLEEYFLGTMMPQKRVFVKRVLNGMITEKTESGLYKCKKCEKEGRDPTQTESTTRYFSGDEAPLQNVRCKVCATTWKER